MISKIIEFLLHVRRLTLIFKVTVNFPWPVISPSVIELSNRTRCLFLHYWGQRSQQWYKYNATVTVDLQIQGHALFFGNFHISGCAPATGGGTWCPFPLYWGCESQKWYSKYCENNSWPSNSIVQFAAFEKYSFNNEMSSRFKSVYC